MYQSLSFAACFICCAAPSTSGWSAGRTCDPKKRLGAIDPCVRKRFAGNSLKNGPNSAYHVHLTTDSPLRTRSKQNGPRARAQVSPSFATVSWLSSARASATAASARRFSSAALARAACSFSCPASRVAWPDSQGWKGGNQAFYMQDVKPTVGCFRQNLAWTRRSDFSDLSNSYLSNFVVRL